MTNKTELLRGFFRVVGINCVIFLFLFFFGSGLPAREVMVNHCVGSRYDYAMTYNISFIFGSVSIYQLIYVIPMTVSLGSQRKWELMKGIIIGAVLTALITGPCFVQVARCQLG